MALDKGKAGGSGEDARRQEGDDKRLPQQHSHCADDRGEAQDQCYLIKGLFYHVLLPPVLSQHEGIEVKPSPFAL